MFFARRRRLWGGIGSCRWGWGIGPRILDSSGCIINRWGIDSVKRVVECGIGWRGEVLTRGLLAWKYLFDGLW